MQFKQNIILQGTIFRVLDSLFQPQNREKLKRKDNIPFYTLQYMIHIGKGGFKNQHDIIICLGTLNLRDLLVVLKRLCKTAGTILLHILTYL